MFSISYFKKNPKPFHLLAKELFPGGAERGGGGGAGANPASLFEAMVGVA